MPTPHVLVDPDLLEDNLARTRSALTGLAVRPHAKTHKSLEIARRQLAAGAVGLTVATVAEAEVFAQVCDDLFIAYPLFVDEARAARLRALTGRARVSVGLSGTASVPALARVPGLRVLVEVDPGMGRSGAPAAAAGAIAAAARDAGLTVEGVFAFPGHSYSPTGRAAAAADEARELARAVDSLAAEGIAARVVSGGSTPSAAFADAGVLTEYRPGVYVFGDAQQWELGSIAPEHIALTVTSTVVARFADRIVADAGSKVLGADRPAYASGFGRLLDHPEARIAALSEHHATITGLDVPVGTRLRLVPNHVCSAVNLVDELQVVGGQTWAVDARGCNT
ncbi:alanine racemase [Kineococcus sp. SYSU DK003]|uniref:alanine racemase n=1 Tax=Kineococcus sp. SYSU DK003 TaxID=3383124 RepID=UPI003D7DF211